VQEPLAKPVILSFDGKDASGHLIDAAYLGESLQGTARLYNSVAHFWFRGEIRSRVPPSIRIQVGPPKEGSITYVVWFLMNHGEMALHPKLLGELADLTIPHFVKAIFSRRAGRKPELEKALDTISAQTTALVDFAKTVQRDHMQDKARLYDIVERLTKQNTQALRYIAAPVGPSVKMITHFQNTPNEYVIDEPTAEVFRSKDEVAVGDEAKYRAKIMAVDKLAGSCRLELEGTGRPIHAKITDPALAMPGNIYTRALDSDAIVELTAKPILRDGEVATLYVSNAKEV